MNNQDKIKELEGDKKLIEHMKAIEKQSCYVSIQRMDREISKINQQIKELENKYEH